mgnify:CR=1 FL=1
MGQITFKKRKRYCKTKNSSRKPFPEQIPDIVCLSHAVHHPSMKREDIPLMIIFTEQGIGMRTDNSLPSKTNRDAP